MFDPVSKPSHYTEGRKYETIDVIEDWGLEFHLGNALKYISRAGRKDPEKTREDISKAIWYLERFNDMAASHDARVANVERSRGDLPILTTPGGLRSAQSRRADVGCFGCSPGCEGCEPDQEEIEFAALGERLGKDLSQFQPDEIVSTYMEGDMILGVTRNGNVQIISHSSDLHEELGTIAFGSDEDDYSPCEYEPLSDT